MITQVHAGEIIPDGRYKSIVNEKQWAEEQLSPTAVTRIYFSSYTQVVTGIVDDACYEIGREIYPRC